MDITANIYRKCKKLPLLGSVLVGIREGYKNSWIYSKKLRKRDVQKAKSVITSLFGVDSKEMSYLKKFIRSDIFNNKYSYGHSGDFDVMMLYVLVRSKIPNTVVETGVASGRSASVILQALEENNNGTLYSIDLPHFYNTDHPEMIPNVDGNDELQGYVPEGTEPGWLVPQRLRHRWKLILGDSKVELTKLMDSLDIVDIFYHDSDHSYEYMDFEFKLMWPHVPKGGYFLSDDISWNEAWNNFMKDKEVSFIDSYRNFGISKKQ